MNNGLLTRLKVENVGNICRINYIDKKFEKNKCRWPNTCKAKFK